MHDTTVIRVLAQVNEVKGKEKSLIKQYKQQLEELKEEMQAKLNEARSRELVMQQEHEAILTAKIVRAHKLTPLASSLLWPPHYLARARARVWNGVSHTAVRSFTDSTSVLALAPQPAAIASSLAATSIAVRRDTSVRRT